MTRILEQRDPEKVSDLQLAAHASDFVIAGSDTAATALACIVYYLLRDPATMTKLKNELRHKFTSYVNIDSSATSSLPYLKAVILEGLRIYPPLPLGLPRVVPEGGDTIDGTLIPGNVRKRIIPLSNVHLANDTNTVSDYSEHESSCCLLRREKFRRPAILPPRAMARQKR